MRALGMFNIPHVKKQPLILLLGLVLRARPVILGGGLIFIYVFVIFF